MTTESSPMQERRNEMLADAAVQVERLLRDECEVSLTEAESIGNAVADRLAEFWGGQNFTMPKDFLFKLCQRDMAVFDAWRAGATFDSLAREHGMTTRGIRLLISRVRARLARQRKKDQGDLFIGG
jgi:Mor family transcriptional regulator